MPGACALLRCLLAIVAAPDGRQYARRHGQRRSEEADREYEVPGVDGALASLEEHCSVSSFAISVLTSLNAVVLSLVPSDIPTNVFDSGAAN